MSSVIMSSVMTMISQETLAPTLNGGSSAPLRAHADEIFEFLASNCSLNPTFGGGSDVVYDTAWAAMVDKPPGSGSWLFPECFEYILKHQLSSGAWESYITVADGILNTASSLLALKKHMRFSPGNEDWEQRSQKAEASLQKLLEIWDVASADQVGVELLVLKHLSLLEEEGVKVSFPQSHVLQNLYQKKMSKLSAETIHERRSTLYHSLEAFIGHIDFDKTRQWCADDGSMLSSASSTSAYLMNSSVWDNKAEGFLRKSLNRNGEGKTGGLPSVWPSPVFDITWVVAMLAEVGVKPRKPEAAKIISFLEKTLTDGGGILGCSPCFLPDGDDTSKTITVLSYLGREVPVEPMLAYFDQPDHFRTYPGERNASVSVNSNILTCLLTRPDPKPYAAPIAKAAGFLCDEFVAANLSDKWHNQKEYWMMLMSQALSLLYTHGGENDVGPGVIASRPQLGEQLPTVTLQLLAQTIQEQGKDGSWASDCEITAYKLLTLAALIRLPWVVQTAGGDYVAGCIRRAQAFLLSRKAAWKDSRRYWIGKVSYSIPIMTEGYCLAASLCRLPPQSLTLWTGNVFDMAIESQNGH